MDFYSRYKQEALARYPSTKKYFSGEDWKHFISKEVLTLPSFLLPPIQKTISLLHSLKRTPSYQNLLKKESPFSFDLLQDSLLMAYDFHVSHEKEIKLVEVNTNASGFLAGHLLSLVHEKPHSSLLSLRKSFQTVWNIFCQKSPASPPQKVLLIDENLHEQKAFMEFLMYKDFLCSFGWPTELSESQEVKLNAKKELIDSKNQRVHFIYNRTTDFYFKNHPVLATAYKACTACISPHPLDYYLLADKNRLCDWTLHLDSWFSSEDRALLKKVLLPSEVLTSKNQEKAWNRKKDYFFKPLRSYGGRQVYRGRGLTRSRFQKITGGDFLFQELCPPGLLKDQKGQDWKFDLRVFAYGDEIQQVSARLYQGQLTNFKNQGGGFAFVEFSPGSQVNLND